MAVNTVGAVYEGVKKLAVVRRFPSSAEEGWLRHKENNAKPPKRRRRGGAGQEIVSLLEPTTPSAPLRNAAILSMAQPPLLYQGGEFSLATANSFTPMTAHTLGGHRPPLQLRNRVSDHRKIHIIR